MPRRQYQNGSPRLRPGGSSADANDGVALPHEQAELPAGFRRGFELVTAMVARIRLPTETTTRCRRNPTFHRKKRQKAA
jgi:hypothetical protein